MFDGKGDSKRILEASWTLATTMWTQNANKVLGSSNILSGEFDDLGNALYQVIELDYVGGSSVVPNDGNANHFLNGNTVLTDINFNQLAGTLSNTQIPINEITEDKIVSLPFSKLTSQIDSIAQINDNSISNIKLIDNTIENNKMAIDSIWTTNIIDENVTTQKIAINAITNDRINNNEITVDKLKNDILQLYNIYCKDVNGISELKQLKDYLDTHIINEGKSQIYANQINFNSVYWGGIEDNTFFNQPSFINTLTVRNNVGDFWLVRNIDNYLELNS